MGANLPGTASTISDDELVKEVFAGSREKPAAILFTHYHGDHIGLRERPEAANVPMYIGPVAKEIQRVCAKWTNKDEALVAGMHSYKPGVPIQPLKGIRVQPFYVDHSALDAYMFLFTIGDSKILYTGDFRSHGVQGESFWRLIERIAPCGISTLVTEATISRNRDAEPDAPGSEEELGRRAAALFRRHKYNFVLVSSTNIDSIMQMYHNTPSGQHFVCDLYQAEVLLTALRGVQERDAEHARRRGRPPRLRAAYQTSPTRPQIRILGYESDEWNRIRALGAELGSPISPAPITSEELYRDGFVMLVRKNSRRDKRLSVFEKMRNAFWPVDGQIVYSLWDGYIEAGTASADDDLIDFIGDRPYEKLHVGGHASPETLARLIRTLHPQTIIPMHTEDPEALLRQPELDGFTDRIRIVADGASIPLDS